ncbi:HK97 family phage prohead protease [Limnoglobus roseus]|uniref:HK97 family phage prohead protease n=1 Tax=Limnoglobus roseus TaxID=2598579 RepID=A0A5C1AKJ3_9BACT|nr:HK97 family phage prohead protease [Limnoglobus roseus]QEL18536.1 HK97 family phage prohead protease [Limnoglobus roseus]
MKIRTLSSAPEVRDDRRLVFYAAVFDTPATVTENGETFSEVIRPGAFRRTLADPAVDVIADLEHDPAKTFARRSTGLLLQEDPRGLFASAYLPPSALNDQILADVRSGRINGASFQFTDAPGGRRRTAAAGPGGLPTDDVTDVTLIDVTLSAGHQVYKATTVSVRTAGPDLENLFLRLRLAKARRT